MKSSTFLYVAVTIIALISVALAQDPDMNQYIPIFYQNLQVSQTDAIVASRSNSNPNYWFDWVRQSGIAMAAVELNMGNSTNMASWYQRYERSVQKTFASQPNPGFDIRAEPKFETSGETFKGPWNRGQNDGPAYRSIIRINHAIYALYRGDTATARSLYRADMSKGGIKWDLDWVKTNWSAPSYDVWEDCLGYHFHTLMISRKALYKGAVLAYSLSDFDYALELLLQAVSINSSLTSHFDDKTGVILPSLNTVCPYDRKSMDIVVQLATRYGNIENSLMRDVMGISQAWYNGMCQQQADSRCPIIRSYLDHWHQRGTSYWTQPKVYHPHNLFSLWNLSKWSKNQFKIGTSTPQLMENVIARYANDRYDGYGTSQGNPWLLSSFTASSTWSLAGQYYLPGRAADKFEPNYTFYPQHYYMWLDVDAHSISGCTQFQGMLKTLSEGNVFTTPKSGWQNCGASLAWYFFKKADDAMRVPFALLGFPNSLTEQINKDTASPQGAEALTWSYASLIFADYDRRTRAVEPL